MDRDVDLDVTLLDVVGLGIVDEAVRQQTEDADTRTGGTDFDIGRTEAVYNFLLLREQLAIHDAVVEVDAHDSAVDTAAAVSKAVKVAGFFTLALCLVPGVYGTLVLFPSRSSYCQQQNWPLFLRNCGIFSN